MLGFLKYTFDIFKKTPLLHIYFDSGDRKKPTIVLLHGIAATSKTWDVFINEIDTKTYRVVALDLLGFGQSPKPIFCEYNVDDHVEYIHRTIKKLRIRKPFIIVGHSMGAIIAARYSNRYPRHIKKACLVSMPVYLDKGSIKNSILRLKNDMFLDAYKFLLENKDFTIKHSKILRKMLQIKDGIDINESNWNSFRLSLLNTIMNHDVYGDIKDSPVPFRVIYGLLDEFLVKSNVDILSNFHGVKVTKVLAADHSVGITLAKEIINQINT